MFISNFYGTYTLYKKEVIRFLKVYHQTILSPVVNSILYFSIFVMALPETSHSINGLSFKEFISYGLITMSFIQNVFSNSSSSLAMSKILGYIIDIIMPPLSANGIIIAYTLGALTRGIMVAFLSAFIFSFFVDYQLYHPLLLVFYILASGLFLGMVGILVGITATNFDNLSAINAYIISPLSFLSGTFYSVSKLPVWAQYINAANPFFYIIDGMRYCCSNFADGDIKFGVAYLTILNIVFYLLLRYLISIGWKLKS